MNAGRICGMKPLMFSKGSPGSTEKIIQLVREVGGDGFVDMIDEVGEHIKKTPESVAERRVGRRSQEEQEEI